MNQLTPFQQKAIDYTKHISLTANAGSGKTFVLSRRFVEIALDKKIPLNSIVAITFTDKAAGELYKKISDEIDFRILYEQNDWKKNRLKQIRRELVSANISTIHSFCMDILKEFSAEAAIDANFLPLDQNSADDLLYLSIEEVFNSIINENELTQTIKDVIRYFGSTSLAKENFKLLIKNRKNVLEVIDKLYVNSPEKILLFLNTIFEEKFINISPDFTKIIELINSLNDAVLAKKNDNQTAIKIRETIEKFDASVPFKEQLLFFDLLQNNLLTKNKSVKIQGYLNRNHGFEIEVQKINDFFRFLNTINYSVNDESITKRLIALGKKTLDLFEKCNHVYTAKKRLSSYLDFEDILLKTKEVIGLEEVNEALSKKYKYLMIDEYQDTNELQYDIVMPILDYLRINNLFIVGDGKQSIYRFRGAEPAVYDKTKSEIISSTSNEANLSLPHSFRMSPKIAFFVNKLFENLFAEPNPTFDEVDYSNLITTRSIECESTIEFLIAEEESNISEAELLARKIVQLKNDKETNFKFSDAVILCRKRKSFSELESVFIKFEIPYKITGGKGFYQRQIIYDIYNYISFLLNQKDDIALIGILRSPFYHISDRELFLISLEQGNYFYEKFISYSKKNEKSLSVYELFQKHIQQSLVLEEYSLVRQILDDTAYQSVVMSKDNSAQEIANLNKLIALSVEFSDSEFKNLYDFKEYLHSAITSLEDEGQALFEESIDAVNIMTIHQAKGLEFDTVFIYKCSEREISSSIKAKEITVDKDFGVLAKVPSEKGYFNNYEKPAIVGLYDYINKNRELAERKRLLYVAITRAENNLFISAQSKKGKFVEDSFVDLIYKGLKCDPSVNQLILSGELQFMKSEEQNYETYSQAMETNIPVISEIEIEEITTSTKFQLVTDFEDFTKNISDLEKNEVISATKISYFSQCPVKYQLTYEFGYSKFLKLLGKPHDLFVNKKEEDDEYLPADLKGRIVHKILEDQISEDGLNDTIKQLVKSETSSQTEESIEKSIFEIENELRLFYSSKTFEKINNYTDYKNEYEIYAKEGDFYLYGIIDKFILADNKIIIVDYKTDSVQYDQINNKADNYFPQLTFYAYILQKLYPAIKEFELRIIFVKRPDEIVNKYIGSQELISFGIRLKEIINDIRSQKFEPNLDHCSKCFFADDLENCPLDKKNN